jgi:hypothetical protein
LRTRFDGSRARGLSRFVGRDDEMRLLESALARAEHGEGQVIAVVARAGTGKSRLCFELVERCRAKEIMVIEISDRTTSCESIKRARSTTRPPDSTTRICR